MPGISIVLPACNAAATVGRAIESMREQTCEDWELLVVEDGSTDDTATVVEEIIREDERVRLIRLPHGGIVAALNAGFAASRGAFVARMDADDEARPGRLAAQVDLLRSRTDVGVASCLVEFGGDGIAAHGYALHVEWINTLREPGEIARARFIESPVAHPSVLFRRELVGRFGGYRDGPWPEDYELWLRWMEAGVRFAKVPEVLLRWNDPPARLSRIDSRYDENAFYACKGRYLARWLARNVDASRRLFLWGAGRITRKRFASLEAEGVRLAGFIDIDPRKWGNAIGGRLVIAPEAIPPKDDCFIIVGVGVRGARKIIRAKLASRGFAEGIDFIVAA